MQKSLDRKLAAIHADPSGAKDFILADAKDADMAFGIGAAGQSPEMHAGEVRFRTLAEYREQIRQIVRQGWSTSCSCRPAPTTCSRFRSGCSTTATSRRPPGPTTPATCSSFAAERISRSRRGRSARRRSTTFNAATSIASRPSDRAAPTWACTASRSTTGSTTTCAALEEYRAFRIEAERKGFRHFLEVFDPNAPHGLTAGEVAAVHQRLDRPHAGRRGPGRPAGVS